MWRRGTQFYWVGAEVSSTRGGRSIGPPMGVYRVRKINKKEQQAALASGIAATANKHYLLKRYSSLHNTTAAEIPAVIESLPAKTKELIHTLKTLFGATSSLVLKNKSVRAGHGKRRGRKYKSNAGLLIVTANDEKISATGVDVRSTKDLHISDLYPLGRLTLYTQKALHELGGKQ